MIEEVDDVSLRQQRLYQTSHHPVAPWMLPEVSLCPKTITKKNSPDVEVKTKLGRQFAINND